MSSEIVCETCGRVVTSNDITIVRVKTTGKSKKKRQKSQKSQSSKQTSELSSEAQWAKTLEKWGKSWEIFIKKFTKFWTAWIKALTRFWRRSKRSYQRYASGPTISPIPKISQEISSPSQTYLTPKFDPNTGLPLTQVDTSEKLPKVKFDPETGEKIEYEDAPTAQKGVDEPSSQISPKKEKPPITESAEEPAEKELDLEIFTVLEADVRARLLNLSIESEDRIIIGRSFIYLSVKQQRQYLTELERVNEPPGENIEELIQIIQKLPIPAHQQEFLVDQLNYIPETDHQEFASALKPDLDKAPEKIKKKDIPKRDPETPIPPVKKKKKSSQPQKKKRLLSD
jgi:hypothetical protein